MGAQNDRKLLLNCTRKQAVILLDYDGGKRSGLKWGQLCRYVRFFAECLVVSKVMSTLAFETVAD